MDSRETTHEDGDGGATENVVRLPRDWLGPRDELVPIGPRARAAQPPDTASVESLPPDAASFWGEDSGALHSPMAAPVDPRAAQGPPSAAGPPLRPRVHLPRLRLGLRGSRAVRLAPRRRAGTAAVVGLLVACVVVVLAAIGETEGSAHAPRSIAASLSPDARITTITGVNRARLRAHTHTVTHTTTARRDGAKAKAKAKAKHASHHHASTGRHRHRTSSAPPVTNRAGEAAVATTSTSSPATTTSASTASAPAATPASSTSSSSQQPAFGANGQLGPGSSPDG
jgi:hypothetical protein